MFGCFIFAKLACFVKQNKTYLYSFSTQNLGAVAADLLYKSMPGLCLIISRAATYLPKPTLNNFSSLCVYYDFYGTNFVSFRIMLVCHSFLKRQIKIID